MLFKYLTIISFFLVAVRGQSEIILNFLTLNREALKISKACDQDLKLVSESLKMEEIWALKLLDASGIPSSGFVWGNNYWMGSKKSCTYLQNPPIFHLPVKDNRKNQQNLTEITPPMPVEYRVFNVRHSSMLQLNVDVRNEDVIHIGLCFPSSCTDEDSTIMGKQAFKHGQWSNKVMKSSLEFVSTKNIKLREGFVKQPNVILLIIISTVFLMLTINESIQYMTTEPEPVTEKDEQNDVEPQTISFHKKLLTYFSIRNNINAIFSTERGKNVFPALLGIRAICILWTITCHLDIFGSNAIDNVPELISHFNYWSIQVFISAHYAVDTFFFLSAFLMSYSFFESQKTNPSEHSLKQVFKTLFNRYLRLTPIYAIVLLIATTLSAALNDTSSFLPLEDNEMNCKLYWWRNFLYIQNWWPMSEMCMSWSYYLASDFQLFFVACLLHMVYSKNKKLCVQLSVLLVAISTVLSGSLGYIYAYGFNYESHRHSLDVLYEKPYTRTGSYMVGFWTAWYLSKINCTWEMTSKTRNFLGAVILSVMTALVYLPHYLQKPSHIFGALYQAFGRILWTIPVAVLIVTCLTGNGGKINDFLGAKIWYPLSRISYLTFLLNPLVYMSVLNAAERPFHIEYHSFIIYVSGFISTIYLVSTIIAVLFEIPISKIVSNFTKK